MSNKNKSGLEKHENRGPRGKIKEIFWKTKMRSQTEREMRRRKREEKNGRREGEEENRLRERTTCAGACV
jgi:hypothetical protein